MIRIGCATGWHMVWGSLWRWTMAELQHFQKKVRLAAACIFMISWSSLSFLAPRFLHIPKRHLSQTRWVCWFKTAVAAVDSRCQSQPIHMISLIRLNHAVWLTAQAQDGRVPNNSISASHENDALHMQACDLFESTKARWFQKRAEAEPSVHYTPISVWYEQFVIFSRVNQQGLNQQGLRSWGHRFEVVFWLTRVHLVEVCTCASSLLQNSPIWV